MIIMFNLELAEVVFNVTLKKVKSSSNLLTNEEKQTPEGQEVERRINAMRERHISKPEFSLGWIKSIAKLAKKYHVGNCCEKSCYAFYHLLKTAPQNTTIEIFNNPFQDHWFVVIGRNQGESNNPQTWNDDATICDPWSNEFYTIRKAKKYINSNNENKTPVVFHGIYYFSDAHDLPKLKLTRNVLAKSNNVQSQHIIKQDKIVLRNQIIIGSTLDFEADNGINKNIPIAYEAWDFPTSSDRRKQKKLHQQFSLFSIANFSSPSDTAITPPDNTSPIASMNKSNK